MAEPYHVENLRLLLGTVIERYGDLLDDNDHAFVATFESLPAPERSLFTRLISRQSPCFRQSQLRYNDVPDVSSAITALEAHGLLSLQPVLAACLHVTPKPELLQWFAAPRTLSKAALIEHVLATHQASDLIHTLSQHDRWITPCHGERIEKFELCFFGNRHQKLNEFIITELGHVVYETYELSADTRYFNSPALLNHSHTLARLQRQLEAQLKGADIDTIRQLESCVPPPLQEPRYQRRRARVLYQLGREAERRQCWNDAERLYAQSDNAASQERRARHALRMNNLNEARVQLAAVLAHCRDPEHRANALRLLRRLEPSTTPPPFEPASERLILPVSTDAVERAVAAHFTEAGRPCFYTENLLFNGLLGLLFWDILFQPVPGAFANRFQRAPLDLYEPEFVCRRQPAIDERLALIGRGGAPTLIEQHLAQKQGLANTLVHWEFFAQLPWRQVLSVLPARDLQKILGHMLEDLGNRRAGFPDLFLIDPDGRYQLLEVKGPGDSLRENQRAWLQFFAEQAIEARVVQVDWAH